MTDWELIDQSIAGDTSCFEQLVFRYQGKLMRFLMMRCQNQHDAEDIMQEAFINAHRYLRSYNKTFAFSTWLFTIASNCLAKQGAPANSVSIETQTLYSEHTDSVDQDNIWQLAKRCLTDEQVNLLWFTYVEGYSGKEVGQIMHRSLPWVKINLIRSRQLLAANYQVASGAVPRWVKGS